MNSESKIEQYCLLAKGARGRALQDLIQKVTADPSIFAFGELLSIPSVKELESSEFAPAYALLELFCYGTMADYKADPSKFPPLSDAQLVKLKQLTVVSIAANAKTIQYSELMQQLEVSGVRELEDLIITGCFYPQLLKGNLDQMERCLQVEQAFGRDVRAADVPGIVQGLNKWLEQSQSMLSTIEEKIAFSQQAAEASTRKKEAHVQQVEEVKRQLRAEQESRGHQDAMMLDEPGQMLDFMEEDRTGTATHGRPKRRR